MTIPQDTPSPHARLRELAERATPGPWSVRQGGAEDDTWVASDAERPWEAHMALKLLWVRAWPYGGKDHNELQSHRNAAYIAAANPQVVLGLLDEIERLDEGWKIAFKAGVEHQTARESLEAKLREAEAREAVTILQATCSVYNDDETIHRGFQCRLCYGPIGTAKAVPHKPECSLSSPSAAASALVTRLAAGDEYKRIVFAVHGYLARLLEQVAPEATPFDELELLCTQIDNVLAAARQNARTPGTVEVCPRWSAFPHECMWFKAKGAGCDFQPCPLKDRTASSPQAGEDLDRDIGREQTRQFDRDIAGKD